MNATCPHCSTTFCGVDRDEDGRPEVPETTRCAHPGCEVYLCGAGCTELSFECDACNARFCSDHGLTFPEGRYCLACALEAVESYEPECECHQTDVDQCDASGCELHDSRSDWNVRLRAVTAMQQLEREGIA